MKIVFCGTHSTGKTSAMNFLINEYKGIVIPVYSNTRQLKDEGFEINNIKDNYDITQLLIGNRDFEQTFFECIDSNFYICDRCLLDTIVYTDYLVKNDKVHRWILDYQINLFYLVKEQFDYYLWFQNDIPLTVDNYRVDDEIFRNVIHYSFKDWFQYFDLDDKVSIISGQDYERTYNVKQIILSLYEEKIGFREKSKIFRKL